MTIVVRYSEVKDDRYPAPIKLGTKFWYEWLEDVRSFRYECSNGNISVIKDDKGYWTASKKVDGVLRRKRLGVSQSITEQKLVDAVNLLCLNSLWNDYLREQGHKNKNSSQGMQFHLERLQQRITDLESQLQRVSQKQCDTDSIQAVRTVLENALKLKPNAGGAIKIEIRKALEKLL